MPRMWGPSPAVPKRRDDRFAGREFCSKIPVRLVGIAGECGSNWKSTICAPKRGTFLGN